MARHYVEIPPNSSPNKQACPPEQVPPLDLSQLSFPVFCGALRPFKAAQSTVPLHKHHSKKHKNHHHHHHYNKHITNHHYYTKSIRHHSYHHTLIHPPTNQ
ncbi:hypothetical protein BJ508DRAFT_73818 [Ascobolus immersus RN42]|uniref:Uncharacterized protein n=1 Tax=Ascobolus immersus RN42 TaxID=1160509 RepID=A0A3N4HDV0_ASCIM|nr:hypothetical protein BJ508DRAFT_73818 [Ascobolus immersus RN42]